MSSLNDFYYNDLYDFVAELEVGRKNIVFRLIILNIIYISLSFILYFYISFFAIVLFLVISTLTYAYTTYGYFKEFKTSILEPLIYQVDKNLKYLQDNFVSQKTFENSFLFEKPDRYSGSDLMSGTINGVPIELSYVNAQVRQNDRDGKTHYNTLFNGIFIVAKFNKVFMGKTIIMPDYSEKFFGDIISSWLQKIGNKNQRLIKLDDIEFEREFKVYGDDEIEAHYILNHALMQRILELKRKANSYIYISFLNQNIYVAISGITSSFNPPVFSSLLEFKVVDNYTQVLNLALGIVDELKLNQKLWADRPSF